MEIRKSLKIHCLPISVFLIIVTMMLVASATGRQSSAFEFDPDYPVGTPPILGGTGYVTEERYDGDNLYNVQDWQEYNSDAGGYHPGEDWNGDGGGSSDVGTPVYAIAGGTVVAIKDKVFTSGDYGSGIAIEHTLPNGGKIYSVYVHIDITSGLNVGDFVGQGDRVGTIANITSLPPHLHFEIRTKSVDPKDWYPNDNGIGYYATIKDLYADGFTVNPSVFIDSHREWSYSGSAYMDGQNGYMVLTPNNTWQVGNIWLKQDIASPFTIEFKYKVGGGTGADGLTLMFYKDKDYEPGNGGRLGFNSVSDEGASGYGIEFDNYENPDSCCTDPNERHIALIRDSAANHLRWVEDPRTEDNLWHQVMVEVSAQSIEVYVDGNQVITFEGNIDRSYGGLGFSAATGSLDNWHLIDDVRISASS
jgi:hypothetical protein